MSFAYEFDIGHACDLKVHVCDSTFSNILEGNLSDCRLLILTELIPSSLDLSKVRVGGILENITCFCSIMKGQVKDINENFIDGMYARIRYYEI